MKARVQNLMNQRQLSWVDTELREFEFDVGHKTEGFALDEDGLVRKLQVRQLISASLKVTRIIYESTTVYACCIVWFAVYALYCIALYCIVWFHMGVQGCEILLERGCQSHKHKTWVWKYALRAQTPFW